MAEGRRNPVKYQLCCDKILEYIRKHRLTEGDKLPTESQMMEFFGVSRITVRRAVSELEARGLVKKIQGSGCFLASPAAPSPLPASIPMIIPGDSSDTGLLSLIQGAGECLARFGCRTSNYFTRFGGGDEERILRQLAAEGAKCVLIFPTDDRVNRHLFPQLERRGMEFVYMGRKPAYASGSFVGPNDVDGGCQAASHLITQGYSRIAFLSSSPASTAHSIPSRLRGYREALEENGLPYDERYVRCVEEGENFTDVLAQLMALAPAPDAFFCVNDMTAVELMYRLEPYQVPGKPRIAVMGFDNSSLLKTLPFSLSTIEQSFYAMGYEAAQTAVQLLTDKPPYAIHKILPVKLIVGETTPKKE